tara:strand:- start:190 stop:786 length:597 start_codon:yes stop_codon:yes gene_type:complete
MDKKYIKINLNQLVSRFQRQEMRVDRNRNLVLAGLILAFAILFSINSYTNFKTGNLVKERKSKIDDVKKQIQALALNTSEDEQKVDMKDIKNLFKFEEKRVYWTPKIQALTNLTPTDMAITEISFDSKYLKLIAITKFEEGMDTEEKGVGLIKKIVEHPDISDSFKDIELKESYTSKVNKQKTVFYEIQAKIKKQKKK